MATIRIETFRNGTWNVRGEGEAEVTVEQVKAMAPSYALQYAHRFYIDGVLVHEEPAPKKTRKSK